MDTMEKLLQEAYRNKQILHEDAIYLSGYMQALYDYGIYNDGIQRIGCLNRPIIVCFKKELQRRIDINAKTSV